MAFRAVDVEEDVRLAPPDLGRPLAEALTDSLARNLVGRVVRDLGLVVAVVGVGAAEGGVVHAAGGDGAAHWRVAARLATFRPSPGDVLDGQVVAADLEMGLRVRLGRFFDDVFVPPDGLPSPSAFVPPTVVRNAAAGAAAQHSSTGGCWMYRPPPEEGDEGEADELEIAPGAAVRFRVREVRFERGPAPALAGGKASYSAAAAAASPSPSDAPFAPLVVIGDMDGVGLGPKSWWADDEDDDEEEEEGAPAT
jgi:DNA-directed RNA polymerase III subunit RPC8